MTRTAVETKPGFEILRRGVLLQDMRMFEPLSPIAMVHGDVARLTNGETWARPPRGFLPFLWDEGHQPIGHRLARHSQPDAWHEDGIIFKITESPAIAEIRKFREQWPVVASCISLADLPELPKLFELGTIRYPAPRPLGPVIPWQDYLFRHMAGDFGLDSAEERPQFTHDERWLMELQPRAWQNLYAIALRSGVIVSRHLTQLPVDSLGRHSVVLIVTDLDSHQTAMRLDRIALETPPS
jgi:hypothetical protein